MHVEHPGAAALCVMHRRPQGPAGPAGGSGPSPAELTTAARALASAPAAAAAACPTCVRLLVLGLCRRHDPVSLDALLRLVTAVDVRWDEELTRAVVRLADDRFVPLLVRLCTGPRPVALVALDGLATLHPGPGAVRALVAVFTGAVGDRRVHRAASRALVAAGPAAVAALLPYVPWTVAADRRLRQSLAWFLGRADCGTRRAVGMLTEFLSDPCSRTRGEAAASLGLRGDPAAGPVLQRALAHPDEGVRARAATALGQVGAHDATVQLRQSAAHDPFPTVRDAAAAAVRALAARGR